MHETDGVRLETSIDDPDTTFDDGEYFDPEDEDWVRAFHWSQWGISFNARAVRDFSREGDPLWNVVCELAEKLDANVRFEAEGEPFNPVTGVEDIHSEAEATEPEESQPQIGNPQELKMVFPYQSINCVYLSEAVVEWLKEIGITKNLKIDHRRVALEKIPERVDSGKYGDFFIETNRLDFRYHCIGSRSTISVKSISSETAEFWDEVVKRFAHGDLLIQAYLIDVEYQYWQNQEGPDIYELKDKSHEHLRKIKRDAPRPHDDIIIDISQNPGRRVYTKNTVIEAVGGVMWLTDQFFEITKAEKSDVCKIANLEIKEGDFLKITADKNLFQNGDTDENLVNLQNQLREKLFPPLETSSPERDAVVDHKSESQVMVMVFPYGSLNQTRICESTLEWLKEIGTEKNIRADDRNTPLSKALERIHKDGLPHFFLETSRLDFQVRSVDTYNHDIIEIGSNAPESMEFWLSVFARFKSHAPLIQAYLVERNYTRRQYYGKEDLKPGRRIFTKRTVIETVGGIMWFSDRFFKLTSASKTALHKIQDIEIEDDGETMKITADRDLLRNGDTNQQLVNLQNKLRKALFPLSNS